MRFTIAKLIVATILVNLVVCLTFVTPVAIGFPILTFVSLAIIPPAIIVGVVNNRGSKQAFFLGCMSAGVCHFVLSVYLGVVCVVEPTTLGDLDEQWQYVHLVGYIVGLTGGIAGVGMFYLVNAGKQGVTDSTDRSAKRQIQHPLEEPLDSVEEEAFRSAAPR